MSCRCVSPPKFDVASPAVFGEQKGAILSHIFKRILVGVSYCNESSGSSFLCTLIRNLFQVQYFTLQNLLTWDGQLRYFIGALSFISSQLHISRKKTYKILVPFLLFSLEPIFCCLLTRTVFTQTADFCFQNNLSSRHLRVGKQDSVAQCRAVTNLFIQRKFDKCV